MDTQNHKDAWLWHLKRRFNDRVSTILHHQKASLETLWSLDCDFSLFS